MWLIREGKCSRRHFRSWKKIPQCWLFLKLRAVPPWAGNIGTLPSRRCWGIREVSCKPTSGIQGNRINLKSGFLAARLWCWTWARNPMWEKLYFFPRWGEIWKETSLAAGSLQKVKGKWEHTSAWFGFGFGLDKYEGMSKLIFSKSVCIDNGTKFYRPPLKHNPGKERRFLHCSFQKFPGHGFCFYLAFMFLHKEEHTVFVHSEYGFKYVKTCMCTNAIQSNAIQEFRAELCKKENC